MLDEALGADIQSSAPVEVPGKKNLPPLPISARRRRWARTATRVSAAPRRGSGLERLARRQRPGREQERGQRRQRRWVRQRADDRGEAALDGLAKLSTALEMVRSRSRSARVTRTWARCRTSRWTPRSSARLQKMLESVSQCVKLGSLVQMFVPKVDNSSGAVTLVTHRALARVSSMHDKKFWQYHKVSESFFFSLSPSSSEGLLGLPGRCFLYGRTEWTTSVCCYRPMEYPRLRCAIECQVNSTLVVPLFISNSVSEEIPLRSWRL